MMRFPTRCPRGTRARLWVFVLWSLPLLASSCGNNDRANNALPPLPQVTNVQLREYRFDYAGVIRRGRTVFRARNAGQLEHELVVLPLPNNLPPIDVQLHSKTRQVLAPVAHLKPLAAGGSGTFAVDLVPGRYAMVSFLKDRKGMSDALKGMSSEFRVR